MMNSILTVTSAASSYDLTTLASVKDELNITDGSSDPLLRRYISGASAAASQFCNRVFAAETVSERFFFDNYRHTWPVRNNIAPLQLARWPIIAVTSVTEDDTILVVGTDYVIDYTHGQITRLTDDGFPRLWPAVDIVVVYSAGYQTIPADIDDAIVRMVTKRYSAKGRDATLRQENIPGIREATYWIATGTEAGNITPDVADVLDNYRVPVAA